MRPAHWARLKALQRELVRPTVAEHKGRVVKTAGDGILIEFPSVVEAVACALAIQRGMNERNTAIPADRRFAAERQGMDSSEYGEYRPYPWSNRS